MQLSVIIPVYNEEKTVAKLLQKVKAISIEKEIIVVDDSSTDGTLAVLEKQRGINLKTHEVNKGKGAAIKTGFKHAKGEFVIIQDADLEYDPQDILKLLSYAKENNCAVVYGSRFKGNIIGKRILRHDIGNKVLSAITSILFLAKISDMETCYKLIKRDILKKIKINSNRFDFEPEITAKLLKQGHKIHEVPITYRPRAFSEGKKIKLKDGFSALSCLLKYRFRN